MLHPRFLPQSLKTRVTLLTLLIVVVSFLVLAFFTKGMLREELLRNTGEQQRSALNLLSSEVDNGLRERLAALETVALQVAPERLGDDSALQAFLQQQLFLAGSFNGGVSLWNRHGVLQAEAQYSPGEIAMPVLAPPELARVLREGQAVIGRMQVNDKLKLAWFALAVPVRNAAGEVIGVLAGLVRLDRANFLSRLTAHRFGKTGHFFLIDASQRLIFAASDRARLLEVLPAAGVDPWTDRFVQGFEGTARVENPKGVEVLVSIQQIPRTRWYASVTQDPDEAFGLIDAFKLRARLLGLVLVLLCLGLIWLMLRRQLAPMTAAVRVLDGHVRKNQMPTALPVVLQDEAGQLVGGFNRLLDALAQQQKVLRQSELFKQAVLNSVAAKIAVLDQDGVILEVNEAWRRDESDGRPASEQSRVVMKVGSNFLAACGHLESHAAPGDGMTAQVGIRAVLAGRIPRFYLEYASHSPLRQRWFSMSVTPMNGKGRQAAVVSLEDISERIQMAQQVHELAFFDPLTNLPNRRLALERLSQQLVRGRRSETRLALLFIDLDKFKPINDELGHEVGDWLLQAVAQRILACLRASDTAARMGGDEFVVLLPDLQDNDAAMMVAEKICQALDKEFVTEQGLVLSISSSIGVALYPDHGDNEKDLLRLGDEAMYQVKKNGRNAVHLYRSAPVASGAKAAPPAAAHAYVHLRWKDAFKMGSPELDQEHQALFNLANTLLDTVLLRRKQPQVFEAAYEALLVDTAAHFAHEETILRGLGFANLTHHAQQHQVLLSRARALHQQMHDAPEKTGAEGELTKFLVSELVAGHLLKADREFFALFAKS
ncbi:diguanylate cyclase domain-containing protein [Rhodoferax sp.]|uniref:diguanylate cyclase domain-containing protein n=1 Tax=Rhodoferax sp. TaxID=50421 RepID=UPI003BB493D1